MWKPQCVGKAPEETVGFKMKQSKKGGRGRSAWAEVGRATEWTTGETHYSLVSPSGEQQNTGTGKPSCMQRLLENKELGSGYERDTKWPISQWPKLPLGKDHHCHQGHWHVSSCLDGWSHCQARGVEWTSSRRDSWQIWVLILALPLMGWETLNKSLILPPSRISTPERRGLDEAFSKTPSGSKALTLTGDEICLLALRSNMWLSPAWRVMWGPPKQSQWE